MHGEEEAATRWRSSSCAWPPPAMSVASAASERCALGQMNVAATPLLPPCAGQNGWPPLVWQHPVDLYGDQACNAVSPG